MANRRAVRHVQSLARIIGGSAFPGAMAPDDRGLEAAPTTLPLLVLVCGGAFPPRQGRAGSVTNPMRTRPALAADDITCATVS
jgi:hypothetical protein